MNIVPKIKKYDIFLKVSLHLVCLAMLAYVLLPQHANRMFNDLDGTFWLSQFQSAWKWLDLSTGFGINLLQGLGEPFVNANMSLVPTYALQLAASGGHLYHTVTYILLSLELFLSAFFFARLFKFSILTALSAGWVLPLVTLPLLPQLFLFNSFFQMVPSIADGVFYSTLFLVCFEKIGKVHFLKSVWAYLGVIVLPNYLVFFLTGGVILFIPIIGVIMIALFIFSENPREFFLKLFVLVLAISASLMMNIPEFLYGSTFFTAAKYFSQEFIQPFSGYYSQSVLFQVNASHLISVLPILSLIGACVMVKNSGKEYKKFSYLFICLIFLIITSCVVVANFFPDWKGPQISYFEIMLWPLYVIFLCYTLGRLINVIATCATNFFILLKQFDDYTAIQLRTILKVKMPQMKLKKNLIEMFLIISRFFIILSKPIPESTTCYKKISHSKFFGTKYFQSIFWLSQIFLGCIFVNSLFYSSEQSLAYSQEPTDITRYLESAIALNPGLNFKGYATTIAPALSTKERGGWSRENVFDNMTRKELHNSHRILGLWLYNIPTVEEYNDYISPMLYLLVSRLLNRPFDKQNRNIMTPSVLNLPLLQALGVRFLINNQKLDTKKAMLRKKLPINQILGSLYLYEFQNPNLANYSPTHFIQRETATEIIDLMKRGVDFQKTALVSEKISGTFVPTHTAAMQVNRGNVTITANSTAQSALLVPLLYSHCLRVHFLGSEPTPFKMIRANLVETLLIFTGNLKVQLSMPKNIWDYGHCRNVDIKEADKLQIKQVMQAFPLIK